MSVTWSASQEQRLRELNAAPADQEIQFPSEAKRDETFHKIVAGLVKKSRQQLQKIKTLKLQPKLYALESALVDLLIEIGFIQVVTPMIISRGSLEKMALGENHALLSQVFWLSEKKCLRPMLAPNLYFLLGELKRIWEMPIRIFEVGPCFRKDTAGKYHMNEFTMLNLVELGLPEKLREKRLRELAAQVMKAAGVKTYQLAEKKSEVYGKTIDVISSGVEVASGAVGPHVLDSSWGVTGPWVGLGFGLERLVMIKHDYQNIQRAGRALVYLDGIRLNI